MRFSRFEENTKIPDRINPKFTNSKWPVDGSPNKYSLFLVCHMLIPQDEGEIFDDYIQGRVSSQGSLCHNIPTRGPLRFYDAEALERDYKFVDQEAERDFLKASTEEKDRDN
ncbi:hypothetical protein TNCV_1590531 [Trichonephila clavipes]|nr:hypothetical protein TNCV_1590531 [Trichonephila clavipes]